MSETITEERVELMVSPIGDSSPTLRPAHFLNPSVTAIDGAGSEIPSYSVSYLPHTFHPKEWPLEMKFKGWRRPTKNWIEWVDKLHSAYESHWKKLGIYEAIMSSKYEIYKNNELIFGVAEKWCPRTNTFVFPWGEATITLEDMVVLGGYPVLGASVLTPFEDEELKEIERKLIQARKEALKTRSNKASVMEWIKLFLNKGREFEHEAFLSAWLSISVFPNNYLVNKAVFPIAIYLARGNPIALAPAILASIYKELDQLKKTIVALPKFQADDDEEHLQLDLSSPFWLVQIWVWERIEALQPKPKLIHRGDPVIARWQKVRPLKVKNVRLAINSAGEGFHWRPYAILAGKHHSPIFYPENEMWVALEETSLDKKLESFIICLRVSELVGFDCIKQYLPQRVAMQFGLDQDVPGCVPRFNQSHGIAWDNYRRAITCGRFYIPPRLFEADVTTRYLEWWKQSVMGYEDPLKDVVKGKRSPRGKKHVPQALKGNIAHNGPDVPPGFPPKRCNTVILGNSGEGDDANVSPDSLPKRLKTLSAVYSAEEALKAKADNRPIPVPDVPPGFPPKADNVPVPDVPPGFPPKHNTGGSGNSVRECEPATLKEIEGGGMSCSLAVAKVKIETLMEGSEQAMEDANGSKELCLANERERPQTEGEERINKPERKSFTSEDIEKLAERISRLEKQFVTFIEKGKVVP